MRCPITNRVDPTHRVHRRPVARSMRSEQRAEARQPTDDVDDPLEHVVDGPARVDDGESLGLALGGGEETGAHAFMERDVEVRLETRLLAGVLAIEADPNRQ